MTKPKKTRDELIREILTERFYANYSGSQIDWCGDLRDALQDIKKLDLTREELRTVIQNVSWEGGHSFYKHYNIGYSPYHYKLANAILKAQEGR